MSAEKSKSRVDSLEIKRNHDGIPLDDPAMKGLARYFNNSTIRGRANVAKAVIAGFAGIGLYMMFHRVEDKTQKKEETQETSTKA